LTTNGRVIKININLFLKPLPPAGRLCPPDPPLKINVVVFLRFVVDGNDDGVQDSHEQMMQMFQAALEEEEKLNANVEKVLDVDKEEDDLSIAEVMAQIRDRENPTNWLVVHPIPEYRRFSRAVSRSASAANTPRRTPRTASTRKFNFA